MRFQKPRKKIAPITIESPSSCNTPTSSYPDPLTSTKSKRRKNGLERDNTLDSTIADSTHRLYTKKDIYTKKDGLVTTSSIYTPGEVLPSITHPNLPFPLSRTGGGGGGASGGGSGGIGTPLPPSNLASSCPVNGPVRLAYESDLSFEQIPPYAGKT